MCSTTFSLNHYSQWIEDGLSGLTQHRRLSTHERMRYDHLVKLFGGELRHDDIRKGYGSAFALRMAPELAAMRLLGATRHDADAIRLTRRGLYCWVLMTAEFFNAVNGVREQMREHVRTELDTWNAMTLLPAGSARDQPP